MDVVYASDAKRCLLTAEVIAGEIGAVVVRMPGLVEAEGLPAKVLEAWLVHGDLGAHVAGGEDGRAVATRVVNALTEIAAATTFDHPSVVVGHVASLTTGIAALCGNGPALWGAPLQFAVPFNLLCRADEWSVQWPSDGSLTGA